MSIAEGLFGIFHCSRNANESDWWNEELRISHAEVAKGRKQFIIPVKLEDIPDEEIGDYLKFYMSRFTYADATCTDIDLFRKKLIYAMPKNRIGYVCS